MSEAPSPAVSGTIVLPLGAAIPEGATWTVQIQDTTVADAPAITIGEVTSVVADPSAMEIPFEVQYDPSIIDEAATYTLRAVVEDATPVTLYVNESAVPVITGGAPSTGVVVEVVQAVAGASAQASAVPMPSLSA
jgi:putative lipoprotein